MTEMEVDPTVIKRTQETLGKYVKKPPLTEKLLKKPPFRFLFDIVKAVIKETGYFDGLYSSDELNFENIKDREDKMRFLQKMIDVVKLTTQRELSVRTSKIVAGHEPERTNDFLQMMSEIIEKQLNWNDAVKTITTETTVNGIEKGKTTTVKKKVEQPNENGKEKPKESSKGKPGKDIKSKEIKNSKNVAPSPEENTKKSTKTAPKTRENVLSRQTTIEKVAKPVPKSKENVLSRQTTVEKEANVSKKKEKVPVKKTKDVVDKAKIRKNSIKDNSTNSSPSPNIPIQNGELVRGNSTETENRNGDSKTLQANSNKLKENLNDDKELNGNGHNNKENDEVELQMPTKPIEGLTNGETHARNSAGSRKSSANRERKLNSSGKNRRSSAIKSSPTYLDNGTQPEAESLKSLKSVAEEIPSKDPKVQANNQQDSNNQQQPTAKQVKREPTFTHENSRDSVGSNSNSSTTRPRTSLRPPSARPPSARPGAPRRRDKNIEIILQPNEQVRISNINVKLEAFGDLDDDGENLVIIEDATSGTNLVEEQSNEKYIVPLEQQGHLVQQILETQKELTQQNGEIGVRGEKDYSETGFDAKARQSSALQMNNLRDIIQNLTKSVNPFGKLMDFIPEDIDAMQLELNMWRDAYSQAASDLKREKSLTESATEPLKNQLISIEGNIKEYEEMIDGSRVKILQNSDKILKMLLKQ